MKSKILYLIIIILLFACSDKSIKIGNVVLSQNNDTLLISENQQVLKVRNILSYDTMQTCRDITKDKIYGKKVKNLFYEIKSFIKDTTQCQKIFEESIKLMSNEPVQKIDYYENINTDTLDLLFNYWKCDTYSYIGVKSNGQGKTKTIFSDRYLIYQTYYSDCDCYKFRFFNKLNYAMETW